MTKKISKGKPLQELVKGSYDYTLHLLRRAFYRTFPDTGEEYFWVQEAFAEYLIAGSNKLPSDEYYQVFFKREGETISFTPYDEWVVVELTYQPKVREQNDSQAHAPYASS